MPLLAVALVAVAASAAVSYAGAKESSQAQANAENYNAQVASNNAGAAAQQAKFNANQIQDQTRRNVATQRAAMAASGFDANTGTFAGVTADTKRQGELNKLSAIYQGRLGSNQQFSQSQLDNQAAASSLTAGQYGEASSILGGVTQATGVYTNPTFHQN